MEYLNFNDAASYLEITRKYLENYVKAGREIPFKKRGRSNTILIEDLDKWKNQKIFSTVLLDRDDYIECLEFAIRSFYQYRSTSDFGTSQQRDAGKFITNFVIGKLGETALKKFLFREFQIEIKLDFELRDEVVGQDITEIIITRNGRRLANPPKQRVSIKTSKIKNVWLVVSANEVDDINRSSDIYVFTRVDLFLNHFIRILKQHDSLKNLTSIIPDFSIMEAQICGYATREQLLSDGIVNILPISNTQIQPSYIKAVGELAKTREEWNVFINNLI
ncbi:MAG: helix-turn-helix domain-containing protein [Melioribacteraceae bacterium]|nr:MAG: helix-turn-helix domain-containing protein [Melioribacteraceae bacterium]